MNINGVYEIKGAYGFHIMMYFKLHKYNKHLRCTDLYIDTVRRQRMLYISGLKCVDPNNIYLYTLKDFDRYIQILGLIYSGYTFTYNREEIIKFYKGVI